MRVTVVHETVYSYESPVNYSVQYLRLSPRSTIRQRVLSWKLETPGPARHWIDAFGNDAHVLVVDRPHAEIRVRARGEIEVADEAGLGEELGPQGADVYLRATPLTAPSPALTAFAADFRTSIAASRAAGLRELMHALRGRMEYKSGATQTTTSAVEAFERGIGVCQDHAHAFIACCRTLDVPARYVSGYLAAADGGDGDLASHAWAEAWLDGKGWSGFDIANRVAPDGRHVRLAVGLDYLDACPVRGFRRGGAGESMQVDVRVHDSKSPQKRPNASKAAAADAPARTDRAQQAHHQRQQQQQQQQ